MHAHFNEPGREDWEGKDVGCTSNVQRFFSKWTLLSLIQKQQSYHQMHHWGTHQALHDV